MKNLITVIFIFIIIRVIPGQSEMLVNTYQDSTQRDPQIITSAEGNFIVIWNSEEQVSAGSQGDIYLQKFDAAGNKLEGEELVNTITLGDQEKPAAAMNSQGDYIITWASFTNLDSVYDIKARLYNLSLPAPSVEFIVNSTIVNSQTNPDADIFDDGSFIIVWDSWFQDGSDRGIYAQRFNSNGTKIGEEFLVNTTTTYSQTRPAVKYFADGRFIIAWESWKQDDKPNSGYGVYAQIFNANGSKSGSEFLVNTYVKDYQWFADIETLIDNSFIITWCSWEQDGDDGGIYFQKFNSGGEKIGAETLVNQTTAFYQWLPKIAELENRNIAFIWSAWKQDGSREGVYAVLFDSSGTRISFEKKINDFTESYQWEPDLIVSGDNKIKVTWATWNQFSEDYDIVLKDVDFTQSDGVIEPGVYNHASGRSTTKILVHVMDSSALTGHEYEVNFKTGDQNSFLSDITDITAGKKVIQDFLLLKSKNTFNLTPQFDGAAVQIIPEFELKIDIENSYFVNHSGTNIVFNARVPGAGLMNIAPIDIALVWGSTDTLADGTFAAPLDTAIGINGLREIVVPFKAINITDDQKVNLLIQEAAATKNKRWDPKENIIFLTPPPYQTAPNNTHAQISNTVSESGIIKPSAGDTFYVFTTRPLTVEDKYRFRTDPSSIISSIYGNGFMPGVFFLEQNYPNPFNPSTNISYDIPEDGLVKLNIYNLLGEKVTTLLNENQSKGQHRIKFIADNFSSGVYFYVIEFRDKILTRKMILIR